MCVPLLVQTHWAFSRDKDAHCLFNIQCTYREQDDGDSQSDCGENSQTHQQQHGIELVHLGEGVEQLGLHVVCVVGETNQRYGEVESLSKL